jgi:RsiW-degrading membrane proteinase PrsW (M82 family)
VGFLVSFLGGILPMLLYAWLLYRLDRYEREPLALLIGVFGWGAVFAAGTAFLVNTISSIGLYLVTGSEYTTQLTLSTLIAPAVEETLKGAAVLFVYLVYTREFDSPLDGVIYSAVTALGFAATENIWYIYQFGYLVDGWQGTIDLILIRSLLVGWQHPFYTAFIGVGFALARRSRHTGWKWAAPLAGWSLAICFHLMHNLLSTLLADSPIYIAAILWDWSGYLGLLTLIILLIRREQGWMKKYLASELGSGLITAEQYQVACSAWRQSLIFLQARSKGKYHQTRDFYQACGDLMHKKRQLIRNGEQLGEGLEIQRLRSVLASLAKITLA